jgi:hypothetical protein
VFNGGDTVWVGWFDGKFEQEVKNKIGISHRMNFADIIIKIIHFNINLLVIIDSHRQWDPV